MKAGTSLAALALLATSVFARDVPANVKSFKDKVSVGSCSKDNTLKTGFLSKDNGVKSFAYCKYDNATSTAKSAKPAAIFIKGKGNGVFTNMDIDCDGDQSNHGDGRCGKSTDTQSQTAFKDTVQQYSKAAGKRVPDLNANFHPYVVFGNEGNYSPTFDPRKYGVQPLSVIAVVCGDKLVYGVWGDTNGDDGPPIVGEASIALATACFGKKVNGNSGHDEDDVLFIAFPGSEDETVPKHAHWAGNDFEAFEESISGVGDELIKRLA